MTARHAQRHYAQRHYAQLVLVRERLGGNFEIARGTDGWRWTSDVATVYARRRFVTAQQALAHADFYTRIWHPLPSEAGA